MSQLEQIRFLFDDHIFCTCGMEAFQINKFCYACSFCGRIIEIGG